MKATRILGIWESISSVLKVTATQSYAHGVPSHFHRLVKDIYVMIVLYFSLFSLSYHNFMNHCIASHSNNGFKLVKLAVLSPSVSCRSLFLRCILCVSDRDSLSLLLRRSHFASTVSCFAKKPYLLQDTALTE